MGVLLSLFYPQIYVTRYGHSDIYTPLWEEWPNKGTNTAPVWCTLILRAFQLRRPSPFPLFQFMGGWI